MLLLLVLWVSYPKIIAKTTSMISVYIFILVVLWFHVLRLSVYNHFKLILVRSKRLGSNFILLHVVIQFSQYHLLKRLSFSHWVFLTPLSNRNYPYTQGIIVYFCAFDSVALVCLYFYVTTVPLITITFQSNFSLIF